MHQSNRTSHRHTPHKTSQEAKEYSIRIKYHKYGVSYLFLGPWQRQTNLFLVFKIVVEWVVWLNSASVLNSIEHAKSKITTFWWNNKSNKGNSYQTPVIISMYVHTNLLLLIPVIISLSIRIIIIILYTLNYGGTEYIDR